MPCRQSQDKVAEAAEEVVCLAHSEAKVERVVRQAAMAADLAR